MTILAGNHATWLKRGGCDVLYYLLERAKRRRQVLIYRRVRSERKKTAEGSVSILIGAVASNRTPMGDFRAMS